MRSRSFNLIIAICLSSWISSAPWAFAAVWVNPFGGDFENPANWSGGVVPMAGIDAEFGILADYEVLFNSDAFSEDLLVFGGNVTFAMGMGSVYNLSGNVVVDDSSLIVNGGQLNNFAGSINVLSNATLGGTATVINTFMLDVDAGGELSGTITFNGSSVLNNGLVAPGNSPVTGSMIINAEYTQGAAATLDIEVSGPLVGQHDQLQVNGTAQLAGRLSIPFINGYVPQANDTIPFLTLGPGSSTQGQFDILSMPALPSGLAARIDYGASAVSIAFVAPMTQGFNSGNLMGGVNDWNDISLWGGGTVPDSASVVNVVNQQNFDARIQLTSTGPAAFTHRTTLGGVTNTMTLAVLEDADFTAMERLNVNNRGVVELAGGTVHSPLVKVNPGGQLVGNGIIDGDVLLGATSGSAPAVLSPGFSSGEITIEEDLTIAQNGTVKIEVFADDDFDIVIVDQNANLGGTLEVVIPETTDIEDLVGVPIAFLTAGDVNFEFHDVDLGDNEAGYFIDVDYSSTEVALSVGEDGNMDYDTDYDMDDVRLFATGLTNLQDYIDEVHETPFDPGDMNGDGFFDFDDIELFSQIEFLGGITSAEVLEYLSVYTPSIPEPSTSLLVAAGFVLFLGTSNRPSRDSTSISRVE